MHLHPIPSQHNAQQFALYNGFNARNNSKTHEANQEKNDQDSFLTDVIAARVRYSTALTHPAFESPPCNLFGSWDI